MLIWTLLLIQLPICPISQYEGNRALPYMFVRHWTSNGNARNVGYSCGSHHVWWSFVMLHHILTLPTFPGGRDLFLMAWDMRWTCMSSCPASSSWPAAGGLLPRVVLSDWQPVCLWYRVSAVCYVCACGNCAFSMSANTWTVERGLMDHHLIVLMTKCRTAL